MSIVSLKGTSFKEGRKGHRFIRWRMIVATNSTAHETQTITFQKIMCSPTYVGKVGQIATFFSAANIVLFITAFLGPVVQNRD